MKRDEAPGRHLAVTSNRSEPPYRIEATEEPVEEVDLLLADVARAAAFDDDPASSALWIQAPAGLRHKFADARCDRGTFWLMLSRWLSFRASIERDVA